MSKLETNYIEQGDCFKLLKNIPDNSIDLVLTDPPYEFRANSFGGGKQELSNRAFKKQLSNENLNRTFETNMLDEFERICKKSKFCNLWHRVNYEQDNELV
nr:MAG TPA: adenine-specific methyltransferase [Caudoviricetes sp.]